MQLSRYRRQFVFLMDFLIMTGVAVLLFLISPIGNGTGGTNLSPLLANLVVWFLCIIFFQVLFDTYDSLWRYAEGKEYLCLLLGYSCGTGMYLAFTAYFFTRRLAGLYMVSVFGISVLGMLLVRFAYRFYRARFRQRAPGVPVGAKKRVAIIGAGDAGALLLQEILGKDGAYAPVLLLDDDPAKINMNLLGVPVVGPIQKLPQLLEGTGIKELILSIPSCPPQRRREILQLCTQTGCKLRILPERTALLSGSNRLMPHMRSVQVEDLLGREPICMASMDARAMVKGKTVLVTGGGGSIGSELCRQMASYQPKQLIILDNYEHGAYNLQQELKQRYGKDLRVVVEIATVQDVQEVQRIFAQHQPDIVFHAAAHKHVPLMEDNPSEAVKNNVFGTLNVANAACSSNVDKFVLISTDKAVNPTNVMGATKRLCEMLLSGMNGREKTKFVAVRFGNVLGSNGSVIPLFQRQIEEGGPVTITDKRIIRYFMTISEAVSLILQAGAMAKSSEVYVLDMGRPVHILELAENLIRLSGFAPYTEMPITEIGLRPGEKLYEELLVGDKNQKKTENKLIFVENARAFSPEQVNATIYRLRAALQLGQQSAVVEELHRCVPEFRSPQEVNGQYCTMPNQKDFAEQTKSKGQEKVGAAG